MDADAPPKLRFFFFQLNLDSINSKVGFGLVWFVICDGAVRVVMIKQGNDAL